MTAFSVVMLGKLGVFLLLVVALHPNPASLWFLFLKLNQDCMF